MTGLLFTGMTICLTICTLFPNGQTMRPPVNPDKNIFSWLIVALYKTDTSTNVFPSIHVFASLGVNLAWLELPCFSETQWIPPGINADSCFHLSVHRILKQHSVLDGLAAIVLTIVLYSSSISRNSPALREGRKRTDQRTAKTKKPLWLQK